MFTCRRLSLLRVFHKCGYRRPMVERGSFNRHPVALNDPPFSRFYYRGATAIIRQVHSTTSVMADDNLTKQMDEIEALSAIYPDEWKTEDEAYRTYSIAVSEGGKTATLLVTLPPEYPSHSPPFHLVTAPWMTSHEQDQLCSQLDQICTDYLGESVIHMCVEKVHEFLHERQATEDEINRGVVESKLAEQQELQESQEPQVDEEDQVECPTIVSTEPFTDRKSKFQGHAAVVTSTAQVKLVLAELYKNRKIAQATHNMYAYRIYNDRTRLVLQDCEDDGETHAGSRMMHLMQILDVKNVLVVVSRWFGGVLLGGDRFKHINNATRDALELGGFLDAMAGDDPAATKKRNKKSK